jgi:ubiquinone biosynthesis protein
MSRDPSIDPIGRTLANDLRATLEQIRDTVVSTAQLVGRVGQRLDAFSLELARDVGAVTRDARAFAGTARDQATTVKRATPRAIKLAKTAAAVVTRQRWLRLQAVAAGHDGLRDDDHRDLARRVTEAAAELRGGIAKLGQLASCRPDLIGPVWASELAALQDEVPPVPTDDITQRIEAELGRSLAELFATFDDTPLAAASLAQVHAATLLDGTRVVVKVQVPGIEDIIEADIAALRVIANAFGVVPGMDLPMLVAELGRALVVELDYVAEAVALRKFASPRAIAPVPIETLSSGRVLTMTRIDGERLTGWLDRSEPETRDKLLGELVGEVAEQILVRGHVHADPHPGNFLVGVDGKLAILDFGCTLQLDKAERAAYARLVIAIASTQSEAATRELAALGFSADDPAQLVELTRSLIGAMRPGTAVSEIDWEHAVADQLANAKQLGGLTIPRSFVLLGRVLATLAGLLAKYKPRIQLHPLLAGPLAKAIA